MKLDCMIWEQFVAYYFCYSGVLIVLCFVLFFSVSNVAMKKTRYTQNITVTSHYPQHFKCVPAAVLNVHYARSVDQTTRQSQMEVSYISPPLAPSPPRT